MTGKNHVDVSRSVRRRRNLFGITLLLQVEDRGTGCENPPVYRERQRSPWREDVAWLRWFKRRDRHRRRGFTQAEKLSRGILPSQQKQ